MIISNQIEHIKILYNELNYEEVIQFGTITLSIALKEKRYKDALSCFEYIASAYVEVGHYDAFFGMMEEYEKLCAIYGEDYNKMMFYYLFSILHSIVKNYDKSIDASKRSIKYAHFLQHEELIVINYANLAAQLIQQGQREKAKMALDLLHFYKSKLLHFGPTLVKCYLGMLYYYALAGDESSHQRIKEEFLQQLPDRQPFYLVNIVITEAILANVIGNQQASVHHLEKVFNYYKAQQNPAILKLISIFKAQLCAMDHFRYKNELQDALAKEQNDDEKLIRQHEKSEWLFLNVAPAMMYQYPNVISPEVQIDQVERTLLNNQSLYCIQWSFHTEPLKALFGDLFIEQLVYSLFEKIYAHMMQFETTITIRSTTEGEAIIQKIEESDFFHMLMNLEEKLQSYVVHSTMRRVEVPIHFGFIHSAQLPIEQRTYKNLVAHADASLYYAKSQGQFYIYS